MNNILLTRIDNRLVHGQVGVSWTRNIGANLIVVANDNVANNEIEKKLMNIVASSQGVGIRFFSIDKTAEIIDKAGPDQKIFLVCRDPQDVRRLVEKGVSLKSVNVGNMHFSEGKERLSKKVYVDSKDKEDLDFLKSQGIEVFIQDIPGDKVIDY